MNLNIIGGADGPTAIFISSSFGWVLVLGVIIVLAGIVFAFIWRKR